MEHQKIEALIADYLKGNIKPEQEEAFKSTLRENGYEISDLSELEALYHQMEAIDVPDPSEQMDVRFHAMLKKHKQDNQENDERIQNPFLVFKSIFSQKHLPQLAYSVILLMLGWALGTWLIPGSKKNAQLTQMSTEIRDMREMMVLTLIDQSSVTQRIKAVNLTNNFDQVNERVVQALLKTLNNDPNENVRLVTVEALFDFADNPIVREGLIQSIGKQESALVQLALADVMLALQEKKSVDQFRELLKRKDLNDSIRGRIEKTVSVLM